MKILIVSDFNHRSIGGVQTAIQYQIDELTRQGHKVVLVCPVDKRYPRTPGVLYVRSLPLFRPNNYSIYDPFRQPLSSLIAAIKKRGKFDVLHCQSTGLLGAQAYRIARKLGIPMIQTMHGRDDVYINQLASLPRVTARLLRWGDIFFMKHRVQVRRLPQDNLAATDMWSIMINRAARADAVIFPSTHFRQKFIKRGLSPQNTYVVSNGLPDKIVETHTRRQWQVRKPFKVLWCGRVSKEKRPMTAIEAVADLPDVELTIYGDGAQLEECTNYVSRQGLANVTLAGRYDNTAIFAIMNDFDALLYTSYDFDNQPMVLIEAAVAGLPVVYCDPDMTECMPPGGGLLTSGTRPRDFRDALVKLNAKQLKTMHQAMVNGVDEYRQSHLTKLAQKIYTESVRSMQ